ncbi:uncharacterized protein B4U80_12077, partial [Leptotrombidium deliense]
MMRTEDSIAARDAEQCSTVRTGNDDVDEIENLIFFDCGDRTDANVGRRRSARIETMNTMRAVDRTEVSKAQSGQRPIGESMNVVLHTTPDLSASIATYSGKRHESLKSWLDSLETAKSQCNWSAQVVRGIAINRLRGEAKCWQSYDGKDHKEWSEWKKALRSAFDKPLTMREWNEMVNNRKQRDGESVAEYMSEKMALISRAPDDYKVNKEAAVDYLISGVADASVRRVFRIREYSRIHSLIEAARTMDRDTDVHANEQKTIDYKKKEVKWSSPINKQDRRIPEVLPKRIAAKDGSNFDSKRKSIVCYRCNTIGHIANECPQRQQLRIKEAEHAITNCILESKWPSKSITVVDAKVFEKMFEVMVDGGCERTVIRKSAIPEATKVNVCDGEKLKVVDNEVAILGAVLVNIDIGGFVAPVNAAVVENVPFDLIVGGDWRRNANVVISTFPDASIEIKKHLSVATM